MDDVARLAYGAATCTESMNSLWTVAISPYSEEGRSLDAIGWINELYLCGQFEDEPDFVERCMRELAEATGLLTALVGDDMEELILLKIERTLLLLEKHLEIFNTRCDYYIKKALLEGLDVTRHSKKAVSAAGVPIRVIIQPAGVDKRGTVKLFSTDLVADLRAEVDSWMKTVGIATGYVTVRRRGGDALRLKRPVRMITGGIWLLPKHYHQRLGDVVGDSQTVYVILGVPRRRRRLRKKGKCFADMDNPNSPPNDNLPIALLAQPRCFEQLFGLMEALSSLKVLDSDGNFLPHEKAQLSTHRVWNILMLLPTNPSCKAELINIAGADSSALRNLLNPHSLYKLTYCLHILEALVRVSPGKDDCGKSGESVTGSWRQQFLDRGGLQHLFEICSSGLLETGENSDWSEWKQDGLVSLLKMLYLLGVESEDSQYASDELHDVKRGKRWAISLETTPIPRLSEVMFWILDENEAVTILTSILHACSLPRDQNRFARGFRSRAQVVHYAMEILVSWTSTFGAVRSDLSKQQEFPSWVRRLVLEDPEPAVRNEACVGLYRLFSIVSADGKTGYAFSLGLIRLLIQWLPASLLMDPTQELKLRIRGHGIRPEVYGSTCSDYFWLFDHLVDSMDDGEPVPFNIHDLGVRLGTAISQREHLETTAAMCDFGLVRLLSVMAVVIRQVPKFKTSPLGEQFAKELWEGLFPFPNPQQQNLPKFKAQLTRKAAFKLMEEMGRDAPDNKDLLCCLLMDRHQFVAVDPDLLANLQTRVNSQPKINLQSKVNLQPKVEHRSSRRSFVGLKNLGATCYMASCLQQLFMIPQARAAILTAQPSSDIIVNHKQILLELKKLFAGLESGRQACSPRGLCGVYRMNRKPIDIKKEEDMTEFFIDLMSKMEEMTPDLENVVKDLFSGVLNNRVVSLDCPHVSCTTEEFYTVKCQVVGMKNLSESLTAFTTKETLDGSDMYDCAQCGNKVRAEKQSCFKKLPRILCINTMRYKFNKDTKKREKVNTHFSFPMQLDMSDYMRRTLMPQPQQYQEKDDEEEAKESSCFYELVGVTVHSGTAKRGHYYSFIRDRSSENRNKWYTFNDERVAPFDLERLAEECFGGAVNTTKSVTDEAMNEKMKGNSAYMLFYEQRTPPATDPASQAVASSSSSSVMAGVHAEVVIAETDLQSAQEQPSMV